MKNGRGREYIRGWVGGYPGTPKREQQRLTKAYEARYEDGQTKEIAGAGQFPAK